GGATWTTDKIADGDDLGFACCDSSLAFDRFGNLFLTYLFNFAVGVPVAVSVDGGATFRPLALILPRLDGDRRVMARGSGPSTHRASVPDQPTITTGLGSVWVTFTGGGRAEASGAAVEGFNSIGAFSRPEVAARHPVGHFGDVAVGPDGQVLVTYQSLSGEGPGTIFTDLDPDGLGPAGFDPARPAVGTNVGDFDAIPAAARVTVDAEAGLAWDRTNGPHRGRVYLVYTSEFPDESDDLDVRVRYSDDQGKTWSSPVRVNDDTTVNSQFDPKIAIDRTTGQVAISWYDCRNDRGDGEPGDTNGIPNDDATMYAAVSRDGGESFSPNVRVSAGVSNSADADSGLDFGDYEGLAYEAGTFYPVWADNSNSTGDNPDGALRRLDIYTAAVPGR
ncbi:MAG TPA: sialidase family protein, partial [Actinomycetota bacterium]